jgi:hypothetical protein
MQNLRAFFVIVSAVAVLAAGALLTASFTIAFAGILAVLSIGRAVSLRLKPVPVRARSNAGGNQRAGQRDMRVWNDGRGTIIDL